MVTKTTQLSPDSLIFDLDGTLWDTAEVVALTRNQAIDHLQLKHPYFTVTDVAKTMGLPHDQVIKSAFSQMHLSLEQEQSIRLFTDQALNQRLRQSTHFLYPKVKETLLTLQKSYRLFLVSNCSQKYLESFWISSQLSDLFADSECFGRTKKTKAQNITAVIERNRLKASVYVGDTQSDYQAAHDANTGFIHAAYGFGKPVEPCTSIANFAELPQALI